jgi:PAS domain S-box-containing protein
MPPTHPPIVLLADDDDHIRTVLHRVLERDGYEVIECADGAAAVAACQRQLPDVALLDILMPKFDGIAACEQIQRLPGGQQVPILMITALDDTTIIDRCFEAGVTDYITKPVNHAILRHRVRHLMHARQAEEALRESEQKYRLLINNANESIIVVQDGLFKFINPITLDLLGGDSEQELIDRPFPEFVHPDDRNMIVENYRRLIANEAVPSRYAFRVITRAGLVKWVEFNAALIEWQGKPATLNFLTDITDRKWTEESLRKSEENYRTLFREMLDGFALHEILCDGQGNPADYRFLAINPALERMTSLKAQDTVGRTVWEVLPGIGRHLIETYGKVALTGEPVSFENYSAELKKHFQVTAFRPAPNQFACIFADITKRKQAESQREAALAALRESEDKFRSIIQQASDGILVADEQGKIIEWNKGMETIFGWSREQMLGTALWDFQYHTLHQELQNEAAYQQLQHAIVNGTPTRYAAWMNQPNEMQVLTAGRKTKTVLVTAFPIFRTEHGTLNASITRDITERKQAEAALQRAHDELEHRARELAALNKANQIIASTLDLDVVLRLVLDEVRTVLNAEGASVLLYDLPSNSLIFAAAAGPDSDQLVGTPLPATAGIAGWVLQHEQPARIDNAHVDPRFYDRIDTLTGLTTRSLLAMPLTVEKTLHQGVIEVINKIGGVFDDHDLELLESMARSAALAIENARLYQAEQQQREFSETLREIGATLVTSLDVDTVLDRLLEQVQRVIPYDAANIMLIAGDQAQVARWRGYERLGTEDAISAIHLFTTSTPTLRQMLETGAPLFISDTKTDTNWIRTPESEWLQSYASVPIRVRDEIIGFLNLGSILSGFFGPVHTQQLQAFADQVAIALENARLYQTEREQFDRLQQSQAQLVQAEKMGALGRLAAALAHEINNPLQAIQSHLELVMDFPSEASERLAYLQIVRQEINRLSQLTRNVLNFARSTPGLRRSVPLEDLIRQTLTLAGKQLQHSHIQVTMELQPTPPVFVAAEQMTQVFLNLVLNAVEAIQQNGQIHITSHVERDQIVISFSNDGPAIRLEDFQHIFEPFYTTKPNGTGLGLSISHRLVQQHGGSLIVENVTDTRGVVFKISLPLTASSVDC